GPRGHAQGGHGDVDAAETSESVGDQRSDPAFRAQVGGEAVHGLGRSRERLADSSERSLIVVDEDEPSPFLREALRDRRTHYAGGAGHHRHPVQTIGHYSPSVGGDDVEAVPEKDRRTMATTLRITMGTMTSSVEMAVRVGSIS